MENIYKVGDRLIRDYPVSAGTDAFIVDVVEVIDDISPRYVGIIVESDSYLYPEGELYGLGDASSYTLVDRGSLPVMEDTVHVISQYELRIEPSVGPETDVFLGVHDTFRNLALGVHFTVDEALDLAQDLRRMAMAIKRGER